MLTNKSMVIDDQVNSGGASPAHTLTVQNYGRGDIALRISGVSEFRTIAGATDILTVMTADECMGFIRLLLDTCRVATGNEELVL
ncbi:hypothetical protein [Methylobacter sp. S3L5C]|uniref:hypothetical protein n=1 Tax=Methylobacter sp. S3L5C TaxID=2839024 RepID=UPI001FAE287F|nr:hypothetical protein [Methylobacter sp. S3L5C]UOA07652.1 hypothetical protein KKZ03_15480 [Methylobacter sp. S3L5C]